MEEKGLGVLPRNPLAAMHRSFVPTLLFTAQMLFSAPRSPAQSSTPSSSCPCALSGSVVDAVSGQPVPHALVKLTAPSPRAALTDSEGKFQFEDLPAGSVILEAEKPGFLTQDPVARWYPGSAQIQLAPDSTPALLKLIPEGVISGQVTGENGEPLEGFTIGVFNRGPGSIGLGIGPDMLHRPAITDDEGKFRIAGLRSGSYYLLARPSQAPAASASPKSSVPSGYAPVFYPAAPDIASAVPVKILSGKTVQANFSLKREPLIRLSGIVSGYTPQERIFVMLQGPSGTPQELNFKSDTGSFQTNWLSPGVYNFTAQADGFTQDGAGISSVARLRVDATSSHFDLRLALQPAPNIPLLVHKPSSSNPESLQSLPLGFALVSKDSGLRGFNPVISPMSFQGTSSSSGGQLFFPRVAPGTYELVIVPSPGSSLYAESATWGSTDLLHYDLVVDSSTAASPIEIVVRDDGASLSGTVSSRDSLAPGRVVLFTGKRKRAQLASVGSSGRFEVSGLAPGDYRAFAIDSSANVDYEDSAFLQKISSKIQEITLTPKQSASINLELATVEE